MDLNESLKKIAEINKQEVILDEIEITSTELHNIANGQCCDLNGDKFSIRYLLKDSFKSPKSNFIINKYAIQIVAKQSREYFKKELIATKTKIEKAEIKIKKESKQVKLELSSDSEELF